MDTYDDTKMNTPDSIPSPNMEESIDTEMGFRMFV